MNEDKTSIFYLFEIERLNNEIKELKRVNAEMAIDNKSQERIIKDLKSENRKKSKWLSSIKKHIGPENYRLYKM